MEKKNKEVLWKPPETGVKKVYVEEGDYRPAGDESVPQAVDLGVALHQATTQLEDGVKNQSRKDIQEGTRTTIKLVNIDSGADPMRPPRELVPNAEVAPEAYQEVVDALPILREEHPGVIRRMNLVALREAVEGYEHATKMMGHYETGVKEMDALRRYFLGQLAPSLIEMHNDCRKTITTHSGLDGKMPKLTKLAVGTGQDAAESKAGNDKVFTQGWNAGQAASQAPDKAPAQATPPGITTTVTSPAQGTPPPFKAQEPAPSPRQPKPRQKDKG